MNWYAIREGIENIAILLGTWLLIPLALVILALCCPPALVWLVWVCTQQKDRKARDILAGLADFFVAIASSLDKFGNCAFGGLLTAVFLKPGHSHKFGQNTETVSEVLGWAYQYNDLNKKGLFLHSLVNMVDFTTVDHCEHARLVSIARAVKKVEEAKLLVNFKPL